MKLWIYQEGSENSFSFYIISKTFLLTNFIKFSTLLSQASSSSIFNFMSPSKFYAQILLSSSILSTSLKVPFNASI